jgi:glyoxalase family protein
MVGMSTPSPAKRGSAPATVPGLHHVTAITGDARGNLDFYTRVLGMRLVKKTVNQDDVSAYHLFYADAVGSPGTDLTFFDWPHSPANRPGAGTIGPVALRVADERALGWWFEAFEAAGVPHGQVETTHGRPRLAFTDAEGQRLELVSDDGAPGGRPWPSSDVPAWAQIKGLHGVSITEAELDPTRAFLERQLGFRQVAEGSLDGGGSEHVFESGEGGPGTEVRLVVARRGERGRPGRGGVHHVAFRAPDDAAQESWRAGLEVEGVPVTPIIDRFYFRSIYFREPGGALFEIATDGPGFAADEPEEMLGSHLALPPFLEGQREHIEAGLVPLA